MLDPVEAIGWAAATLSLTANSMKTMLPLRVAGILSNLCFITYGALVPVYPTLALHAALLPFNGFRMWQILSLTRRARAMRSGAADFSLLANYGQAVDYRSGAHVFRRGDRPDKLYYLLDGTVRLEELDKTLSAGAVFGEIAFFTDAQQRTASAMCLSHCRICAVDESDFMRLYFQHPDFSMAIMKLITCRLTENMDRSPPGV